MIRKFALEHSPVFENVDISFKKGFYVFSGPSGSGKSVLMESLLSCFGLCEPNALNIETDLILDKPFLEEFGLEGADLNIKIVKKDKVRYFVNFTPIAKKRLIEVLGEYVKHIHSRGGSELEPANILGVLDSMIASKNGTYTQNLKRLYDDFMEFKALEHKINTLSAKESEIQNLKEIAEFEVAKITEANPKVGEYERLMNLKKILSKKEKIQDSIQKAQEAFESANNIIFALRQIEADTNPLQDALQDAQARLEEEALKFDELENVDSAEILNRISTLSDLIHRYGSIEGALTRLEEQKQKIQELQEFSTNKECLISHLKELQQQLESDCKIINDERQKGMIELEAAIKELCVALKLSPPKLMLTPAPLSANGDRICQIFLGDSQIQTLSAGEFNRLRLVMMCIAARVSKRQGVLILDEIDANLSGEESEGVANVLKELSYSYQIFAISHQPHMPTLATHHFLVSKVAGKSRVKLLNKEERILEVARMISGAVITQEALDFAKKRLSDILES